MYFTVNSIKSLFIAIAAKQTAKVATNELLTKLFLDNNENVKKDTVIVPLNKNEIKLALNIQKTDFGFEISTSKTA